MFRNIGKKEDYREALNHNDKLYRVEWDYQPIMLKVCDAEGNPTGEEVEDQVFASWQQEVFTKKPELGEIKDMIISYYDAKTKKKILTGFVWEGRNGEEVAPYLSSENQFNYKAGYDLAYQTNGSSLPFRLKYGDTDAPLYYDFNTIEEFSDFYSKCIEHINTCLQDGWDAKDSIDWTRYSF